MFNHFTLYKQSDWGCSRSLLCTPFMVLWWIEMSPPQPSCISSLLIMLHRCLISSSQRTWQNSEVAANTELLLCSSRDNLGGEDGDVHLLLWRQKQSQHSLMSHWCTVTFLCLYSNRGVSWSLCPSLGWKSSPKRTEIQGLRCKDWFQWL